MAEGSFDSPEITRFASVEDFITAFDESGAFIDGQGNDWTRGETTATIRSNVENGCLDAVDDAEDILANIDCEIDSSGLETRWGRSVVGPFPDVAAYLAGEPECMYHKREMRGNRGPINIYYSPVCSAQVTGEEWYRRGVVVLAAAMALSRVRPVNVFYFTPMGKGDHVIPIRTNPMVLSEAAYVLSSPGFTRGISYPWARKTAGWRGGWGSWSCQSGKGRSYTAEKKLDHMRKVLGLGDDDILIPGMHINEKDGILSDPVAWINGLLDKYRS